MDLDQLNALPTADFVDVLGDLFEHSPWIVAAAAPMRPFADVAALHTACRDVLRSAPESRQVELIAAHPDLAGKLAIAGELTAFSANEQRSARLDQLSPEQFASISALNATYRERFGFPFVICVKEHTQAEIFAAFEARVGHGRAEEIATALTQIERIAWHRLEALLAS